MGLSEEGVEGGELALKGGVPKVGAEGVDLVVADVLMRISTV